MKPADLSAVVPTAVVVAWKKYYAAHYLDYLIFYEEIPALLEELGRRRIKSQVVSNKSQSLIIQGLARHQLLKHFTSVLGKENMIPKPNPDGILRVQKQENCDLDEMLYIGDSLVDLKTAKNARCPVGVAIWGKNNRTILEPLRPNYFFASPLDILTIF